MFSDWRKEIVDEALTWRGTPFHHKGRVKGVGCDCGGFIYEVYKRVLGIPHEPFPSDYPPDWALHRNDNEIYLDFMRPYVIPVDRVQPGDITVFKFGRSFSHGAIYLGDGNYIHSFGRTGRGAVVVSQKGNFNIGAAGMVRLSKTFALDEQKWLC